jgi:lipopolysaccharide transport system ATP-binding protein
VIFVSHNMPSILRLCTRAILLDHGRVMADTSAHEAVRLYLDEDVPLSGERVWTDRGRAPGDDVARLKSVRVRPANGGSTEAIDIREPIDIEIEHWAGDYGSLRPTANVALYNGEGVCLFMTNDWDGRTTDAPAPGTVLTSICRIPGNFLAEGRVLVTAGVTTWNPGVNHALQRDAVTFQVVDRSLGDGVRGDSFVDWPGVVRPVLAWHSSRDSDS